MGPACTHSENPMGIPSIPEPHTPFDLHHLIHVATKLQSFGRSIYRKSHNTSMDHYGSRNYNIFGWNPTHVSFWSCNNIICNYIVCLIAHETFEPTETWTIGTCNFSLPSEGINRHQVLKEHIHSTDIWLLQTTKWRKISLTHQEYIKQCFIFGWHPYLSPEASLANSSELFSTALGSKRGGCDCTGFLVRPCRTCAAWAETISGTSASHVQQCNINTSYPSDIEVYK